MPATKRSAEPGTPAAVLEDLRGIREAGGVHHAADDAFAATIGLLAPAQPITPDNRLMAENLILTHVRRVAHAARQQATEDTCQQAAADSFETILSRSAQDTQKVASIRRTAQTMHGCHLSLDGLRKREDRLLELLASEVHKDLAAAKQQRGPQTIEEMARYIIEDVRDAFESIDDGLRRIYKVAPMTETKSKDEIVLTMLYDIAHMQYWFGRFIALRMRVQQHSRVDFIFADAAAVVMSTAFGYYDDRRTVHEVLTAVGRLDNLGFLRALLDHPDGAEIARRFTEWVSSCHAECAYQRTYNLGLLCQPHQLAFVLHMFMDVYDDLISGELEDELTDEFGT